MKRHWTEYTETWTPSPMSYWVRPLSRTRIPGKGYPTFCVEVDDFTFRFASLNEMQVCIEVLGKKLLPNTLRLAQQRNADPDEHWLRKMPEHTRPWRYREKAVKYLEKAMTAFQKEVGDK